MNRTKIEWVKNPDGSQGYTLNPISGCRNHIKGLCNGGGFPCYAYKLANGRLRERYLANENIAPTSLPYNIQTTLALRDPFYPRFWPERVDKARLELVNAKPRGIFVCDMGELFGDWLPYEWQEEIMDMIKEFPQHRFYLLTKQPQNLIKFSPFPDNCWVGVTVTSVEYMADAVANLACTKAKVRFMSFEPLLGSVMPEGLINFLDWVIIGAQTKPFKPPEITWVEEIVRACDKAGVPVFLKDNLSDLIPVNSNLRYGPAGELRLRQEMPSLTKERQM